MLDLSTMNDAPAQFPAATLPPGEAPLRWDAEAGVWRVGATNFTLETLVELFEAGWDADIIAREFTGLDLATVYSALGYYLRWRETLAPYLAARRTKVAEARRTGVADAAALRARLLAR